MVEGFVCVQFCVVEEILKNENMFTVVLENCRGWGKDLVQNSLLCLTLINKFKIENACYSTS